MSAIDILRVWAVNETMPLKRKEKSTNTEQEL